MKVIQRNWMSLREHIAVSFLVFIQMVARLQKFIADEWDFPRS